MGHRRWRSLANKDISLQDYKQAFKAFLSAPPAVDIRTKFGPVLISDSRQLTPAMFCSCKPLLESLLTRCLSSGVVQTWKFQEALLQVLSAQPAWHDDEHHIDATVEAVKLHVQACFRMLRDVRFEQDHTDAERRFPRSGGFRRRIANAGLSSELQETIAMLNLGDRDHSTSPSPATSKIVHQPAEPQWPKMFTPSTPVRQPAEPPWPKMFTPSTPVRQPAEPQWPKIFTPSKSVRQPAEPPWPTYFTPKNVIPEKTPAMQQEIDSAIPVQDKIMPITPMPSKRKRQIRCSSSCKQDKQHKKGKKGKKGNLGKTTSVTGAQRHAFKKGNLGNTTMPSHSHFSSITCSKGADRCEMTSKCVHTGKRIYLCTLWRSTWGPAFHEIAEAFKESILVDNLDKQGLLDLRDETWAKEA